MLQRKGTLWQTVARIKLPRPVKFDDYSAVALRGTRIAVISQRTARLWIGHASSARLDDRGARPDV